MKPARMMLAMVMVLHSPIVSRVFLAAHRPPRSRACSLMLACSLAVSAFQQTLHTHSAVVPFGCMFVIESQPTSHWPESHEHECRIRKDSRIVLLLPFLRCRCNNSQMLVSQKLLTFVCLGDTSLTSLERACSFLACSEGDLQGIPWHRKGKACFRHCNCIALFALLHCSLLS